MKIKNKNLMIILVTILVLTISVLVSPLTHLITAAESISTTTVPTSPSATGTTTQLGIPENLQEKEWMQIDKKTIRAKTDASINLEGKTSINAKKGTTVSVKEGYLEVIGDINSIELPNKQVIPACKYAKVKLTSDGNIEEGTFTSARDSEFKIKNSLGKDISVFAKSDATIELKGNLLKVKGEVSKLKLPNNIEIPPFRNGEFTMSEEGLIVNARYTPLTNRDVSLLGRSGGLLTAYEITGATPEQELIIDLKDNYLEGSAREVSFYNPGKDVESTASKYYKVVPSQLRPGESGRFKISKPTGQVYEIALPDGGQLIESDLFGKKITPKNVYSFDSKDSVVAFSTGDPEYLSKISKVPNSILVDYSTGINKIRGRAELQQFGENMLLKNNDPNGGILFDANKRYIDVSSRDAVLGSIEGLTSQKLEFKNGKIKASNAVLTEKLGFKDFDIKYDKYDFGIGITRQEDYMIRASLGDEKPKLAISSEADVLDRITLSSQEEIPEARKALSSEESKNTILSETIQDAFAEKDLEKLPIDERKDARYTKAIAYISEGDYDRAEEQIKKIKIENPAETEKVDRFLAEKIYPYQGDEKTKAAIEVFKEQIAKNPESPELKLELARIYLRAGEKKNIGDALILGHSVQNQDPTNVGAQEVIRSGEGAMNFESWLEDNKAFLGAQKSATKTLRANEVTNPDDLAKAQLFDPESSVVADYMAATGAETTKVDLVGGVESELILKNKGRYYLNFMRDKINPDTGIYYTLTDISKLNREQIQKRFNFDAQRAIEVQGSINTLFKEDDNIKIALNMGRGTLTSVSGEPSLARGNIEALKGLTENPGIELAKEYTTKAQVIASLIPVARPGLGVKFAATPIVGKGMSFLVQSAEKGSFVRQFTAASIKANRLGDPFIVQGLKAATGKPIAYITERVGLSSPGFTSGLQEILANRIADVRQATAFAAGKEITRGVAEAAAQKTAAWATREIVGGAVGLGTVGTDFGTIMYASNRLEHAGYDPRIYGPALNLLMGPASTSMIAISAGKEAGMAAQISRTVNNIARQNNRELPRNVGAYIQEGHDGVVYAFSTSTNAQKEAIITGAQRLGAVRIDQSMIELPTPNGKAKAKVEVRTDDQALPLGHESGGSITEFDSKFNPTLVRVETEETSRAVAEAVSGEAAVPPPRIRAPKAVPAPSVAAEEERLIRTGGDAAPGEAGPTGTQRLVLPEVAPVAPSVAAEEAAAARRGLEAPKAPVAKAPTGPLVIPTKAPEAIPPFEPYVKSQFESYSPVDSAISEKLKELGLPQHESNKILYPLMDSQYYKKGDFLEIKLTDDALQKLKQNLPAGVKELDAKNNLYVYGEGENAKKFALTSPKNKPSVNNFGRIPGGYERPVSEKSAAPAAEAPKAEPSLWQRTRDWVNSKRKLFGSEKAAIDIKNPAKIPTERPAAPSVPAPSVAAEEERLIRTGGDAAPAPEIVTRPPREQWANKLRAENPGKASEILALSDAKFDEPVAPADNAQLLKSAESVSTLNTQQIGDYANNMISKLAEEQGVKLRQATLPRVVVDPAPQFEGYNPLTNEIIFREGQVTNEKVIAEAAKAIRGMQQTQAELFRNDITNEFVERLAQRKFYDSLSPVERAQFFPEGIKSYTPEQAKAEIQKLQLQPQSEKINQRVIELDKYTRSGYQGADRADLSKLDWNKINSMTDKQVSDVAALNSIDRVSADEFMQRTGTTTPKKEIEESIKSADALRTEALANPDNEVAVHLATETNLLLAAKFDPAPIILGTDKLSPIQAEQLAIRLGKANPANVNFADKDAVQKYIQGYNLELQNLLGKHLPKPGDGGLKVGDALRIISNDYRINGNQQRTILAIKELVVKDASLNAWKVAANANKIRKGIGEGIVPQAEEIASVLDDIIQVRNRAMDPQIRESLTFSPEIPGFNSRYLATQSYTIPTGAGNDLVAALKPEQIAEAGKLMKAGKIDDFLSKPLGELSGTRAADQRALIGEQVVQRQIAQSESYYVKRTKEMFSQFNNQDIWVARSELDGIVYTLKNGKDAAGKPIFSSIEIEHGTETPTIHLTSPYAGSPNIVHVKVDLTNQYNQKITRHLLITEDPSDPRLANLGINDVPGAKSAFGKSFTVGERVESNVYTPEHPRFPLEVYNRQIIVN